METSRNKMETLVSVLKYTAWTGAYCALAWFGFHEGLVWCENIFLFLIWLRLMTGTAGIFAIGHLSNQLDTQQFSYDKSVVLYEKNGNKFIFPPIVGALIEGVLVAFFASMAFWWLAAGSLYILCVSYSIVGAFKDCLCKAKAIIDTRTARTTRTGHTQTEPDPIDAFEDNNDLFRMGIVRTPED